VKGSIALTQITINGFRVDLDQVNKVKKVVYENLKKNVDILLKNPAYKGNVLLWLLLLLPLLEVAL